MAVNWCDNFHDLSIWWGPDRGGGTRYNNLRAMNRTPPDDDRHFMWRSNTAVDFCTKGYCSFLLAYEQTGDPRMRKALDAQVDYASRYVHTDRGEARNIGDADDFMRLYRYTGERRHLDQALRLFRELRTKLSPGDLFSQGGQPIEPDPPFIEDDRTGSRHPFAKPYILGYALLGLPRLARHEAEEPKLRDVVRAVADFMADSQDPAGGWRYPHPRSSGLILSQAVEHAWQIVQADGLLGPQDKHLDAVERVLRQRYHGWKRTGQIPAGVRGWEFVAGKAKDPAGLERLYEHPEDRDPARDYTEGRLTFGSCSAGGAGLLPRRAGVLPRTPTGVAPAGASRGRRTAGQAAGRCERGAKMKPTCLVAFRIRALPDAPRARRGAAGGLGRLSDDGRARQPAGLPRRAGRASAVRAVMDRRQGQRLRRLAPQGAGQGPRMPAGGAADRPLRPGRPRRGGPRHVRGPQGRPQPDRRQPGARLLARAEGPGTLPGRAAAARPRRPASTSARRRSSARGTTRRRSWPRPASGSASLTAAATSATSWRRAATSASPPTR